MNFNKKYLLLIALFVLLVSIPLTFATDGDDTQNTDIDTLNIQATKDIDTVTQTNIKTDNNKEIQEKSRVETSTDKQQSDNNTLVKNDKNIKGDEPKNCFFSGNSYQMFDKNYEQVYVNIRVQDEDYNYINHGNVSVQLDDTLIDKIDLSSVEDYYLNTSNLSFGEHIVLLNYNDETGTYSPCETSFQLIKVEYWPVNIWVEPFATPIYSTYESITLNVEFQDGDSYSWIDRGNVSLSFYVNDEYVPIITRSILAYEEFTPIEIDMNSITSNYGTSYPLNVQYRLNYTDLSGFYENTIKDGSFNVYKLSDYIVEIPSVRFNEGEQVYIPITIKDTEDNVITTNYNISYIKRYGTNISFELLSNNTVSISPDMFNSGEEIYWLDWMIIYENGEISIAQSDVNIILPKSSTINIYSLPNVYKNDKTLELELSVYDKNYWTGDSFDVGTITVKIDDEVIDIVDLSESIYYYLQLNNITVGSHNLTLSYYDESGEHPSNETTIPFSKLDSLRPVYFDSHHDLIAYKNQESVSIDVNVYQYEYEMIYDGFVTITMDNQTIDRVYLQDTYNEYYLGLNEISTGIHNITLTYNDDYGEYTDVETSFTLTILDTYATTMNAYMSSNIIYNTDENVEINYEIKDRYTEEPVNTGNITFYLYHDENYIPIKSVEVNDGILSVDLESILSNYDSTSYPLYIDAKLTYTDSSGQYQQQEEYIYFRIYPASENSVEIPDVEGTITRDITIPVTVKDKDGNIIDPSNYYIRLKDYNTDNIFSFDREDENVIVSTEGMYAKTYTLEWSITFEDNTAITTTSMLKLNPGMNPNFNLTLYNEYYYSGYDLEVYDYLDGYSINYIPGVITIKMDDEITETFSFSGYDYRDLELNGYGLSEGEHIILFLFENSERNISCNSSIRITKIDLSKPNIKITNRQELISILEDETIEINFRVYDENYEDISSGTVTLYIKNPSNQYIPFKTVNATDSIVINVDQLASIYENEEYPIYIDYYLKYNGDNITYGPSSISSQTKLINNKKSKIIFEKYEVCDDGTKFYLKTVDSNNTKINKGTERIGIELYDTDYSIIYEKSSNINADEDYLLISNLNLNEYIGSYYNIYIDYYDNTDEYTSSSYSEIYKTIYKVIRLNLPDNLNTKKGNEVSCPFNFTDEEGVEINLKDEGYFEVSYEENGNWYSFQNLDYDNPIIETSGYQFNEIGNYTLRITYYPYYEIYSILENEKLITLTIEPLEKQSYFTEINEFTVYIDTYEYRIFYNLYDENNNIIYEPVDIFIDDIKITSTDEGYIDLPVYDLTVGNHTLKLIYNNENGEHPSNQTTTNIYKSDKLSTNIFMEEIPKDTSIEEDSINFEYTVISSSENVNEGLISLYILEIHDDSELFEDREYTYIKSDEVSKGVLTLEIDELKSKVSQNYPMNIYFKLVYEGTDSYGNSSISGNYFVLTDKKVSTIDYLNYSIENEDTIIHYTLKDKQDNNITQGRVKLTISTWIAEIQEYDEYETYTDTLNGSIIMENLDLSKYRGAWINIRLNYEDDLGTYEKSADSKGFENTFDVNILVENTIGKVNEDINIPIEVVDTFGNEVTNGDISIYIDNENEYSFDEINRILTVKFIEAGQTTVTVYFIPYNSNEYGWDTAQFTITVYNEDTITSRVELDDINTVTNTPTIITANVCDTENNPLNEGIVTFTDENGNKLGESMVTNGIASITYTFTEETTKQITATYTPASDNILESQNTVTITIESPITNINIEDVTLKAGQLVALTVTVTDQFGNNINSGKVVFKVNGKSIKDENGKVIYAKVADGIATIEYAVPENMAGKDINLTAVYTGTSKYNKETTTKTITVEKTAAELTITPITEEVTANTTITLKAKVTANDNPVTNGKIIFKINGKTIKDENGKVIYANLNSNGEVSVDYNIGNLKAKNYTITAIFTSKDYDKIEDNSTLTVV